VASSGNCRLTRQRSTQLYRPASRANMGIDYEKFLDLLEEVEIHVTDILYPDSDEERSEKSEQGLAAC